MNQKQFTLHHGDCLDALRLIPDCSVDAIVTDPPYGLSFMGKKWDYDVPSVELWVECFRVLKPGGHLLAFAGTRTQHRMAVRIEDAGFEIRDMIAWVYGSGFPKSLDVGKAIDKAAGATRNIVIGYTKGKVVDAADKQGFGGIARGAVGINQKDADIPLTAPATDAAKQWEGWGTALKPALEPITVARKPLIGTVAENVLQYGTGAINVDGCRVGTEGGTKHEEGEKGTSKNCYGNGLYVAFGKQVDNLGRWPANFIHDGSDEVVGLLNEAARFFYCAKASKADRDAGCEGMEEKRKASAEFRPNHAEKAEQGENGNPYGRWDKILNHHPTVKPTDLMRYLCRLVTPPNGIVLDPFNGSGSTGCAAMLEGFQYIGIEREAEYIAISEKRIQNALERKKQVPPRLF